MKGERAFVAVSALAFAASAAVTVVWCASMSSMGEMPMPGGWTMSMAWMRICGQTWVGAAATFVGMWTAMMIAMMLPSAMPTLARYRAALGRARAARVGWLTVVAGAGYFLVWIAFGVVAYPVGVALAAIEMQAPALARAIPIAGGVIVAIVGALQFSAWKRRHLACCREGARHGRPMPADARGAWRYGVRVGVHCSYCCGSLMAILFVVGVMDLVAMALVTAAITAERLAPAGERVARVIGGIVVATGLMMVAQAVGLG